MSDLYVDIAAKQLVQSTTSTSKLTTWTISQDDNDPLNVWFLARTGNSGAPYTVSPIPVPYTRIFIAGQQTSNLEGDAPLFSISDFAAVGSDDTLHYQASANFNGTALNAALATFKNLSVLADFKLKDDANTQRLTIVPQASTTILRSIARDSDDAPPTDDPVYPSAGALSEAVASLLPLAGVSGGAGFLDGVDVSTLSPPKLRYVIESNTTRLWLLRAGTLAANADGSQQCLNYDPVNNPKYWTREI
ncbi:MAG: hypothetical protein QM796_18805 [Chthoniobacteraceae bacterium]